MVREDLGRPCVGVDDELRPCPRPAVAALRFTDGTTAYVCAEHMPDWLRDLGDDIRRDRP